MLMSMGFLLLIIVVFVYLFSKRQEVRSHWHHTFDTVQFSPLDFYKATQEAVFAREIDRVYFNNTIRNEGNILQPYRQYLTVHRHEYVFDICAAPVGTGFFVSWWFVEEFGFKRRLFNFIPLLRRLFDVRTYYRIDNELAYRELIHACVLEAIESMSGTQGYRALTETERRIPVGIPK